MSKTKINERTNGTDPFARFAREKNAAAALGHNAVIYTRVSTKEQADNNHSLETQRKACEQYAAKQGFNVVCYFGGTYESAKTDERNEFKKMLQFLRKSREKINYIIVYSADRFSRSGANAVYIASQLKKENVMIHAVTQPVDANTASGSLQQSIQFIFSQYDNDMRREKCMAGTKEKLLKGHWVTKAPLGYDSVVFNGEKKIVANEKGRLIGKAFYWKAKNKFSSREICKKLAESGVNVSENLLSKIFRNPFYCGILAHASLQGEVIKGLHEKVVSEEIFLEANNVLQAKRMKFNLNKGNENLPLKHFYKCADCGRFLRGFVVKKRGAYYYKCTNPKCNCNKNAKDLHAVFEEILSHYSLKEELLPLMKEALMEVYNEANREEAEAKKDNEARLKELERKQERLEERYFEEELDRAMYEKFMAKIREEREKAEALLTSSPIKKSNLENYIDTALQIAVNLREMWISGDYSIKQKLQYMLFPEGIAYSKKNDQSLTSNVNQVFEVISSKSNNCNGNTNGETNPKIIYFPSL